MINVTHVLDTYKITNLMHTVSYEEALISTYDLSRVVDNWVTVSAYCTLLLILSFILTLHSAILK